MRRGRSCYTSVWYIALWWGASLVVGICFLIHRHRDEVLSLMLHKCVVYCSVVGCQSSGRDLFFNSGILQCGGVPV